MLLSLPSISVRVEFLGLPRTREVYLEIVSFLRIPYSFKFLVVLQFSLVCLGVICRMYVCTSKINFQSVDFLVFF